MSRILACLLLLTCGGIVNAASTKIPRAVQPTHVTETALVLCKSSPTIENTYEIRLTLFFAVDSKKRFELRVPERAVIAPELLATIAQQGGEVLKQECSDFTVSVTHFNNKKEEKDSWVLGDRAAWEQFRASVDSLWLRTELTPGAVFSDHSLLRLRKELLLESSTVKNLDKENVREALLRLTQECEAEGGYVVIQ